MKKPKMILFDYGQTLDDLTRKRDTFFKLKFQIICLQNIYMSRRELKFH